MKKLQITKLWNPAYFIPATDPTYRLSIIELGMAKNIHASIIKIMSLFPDNKFFVDTGILTETSRVYFEQLGRVIPETSDLSFSQQVQLRDPKNIKVFGKQFSYGVGAVQVTTEGKKSPFEIFQTVCLLAITKKMGRLGDIAYTSGGLLQEPVICFSNNKELYFDRQFLQKFYSVKYSVSYNGGVTVNSYKVTRDIPDSSIPRFKADIEEDN